MTIRVQEITVCAPRKEDPAQPLLHRIDTSFAAGSITLIAGRSGSGKSTFLHALAGLIPLAHGSIRYGNHDLWTEKGRVHPEVGLSVGIAFQYPERQLFAENVRKELHYSMRPLRWSKADKERAIREALLAVNLPDSVLDKPVLSLSEGTKRKVAFAATVITKPRWLLLDEPTSGMDSEGIGPLLRMLQRHRAEGGGVIVASHDLESFLPVADRVILLKDGAIEADVTPQQCCDAPELLLEADVGWPEQVRLSAALRSYGMPLPSCPLTPESAAAAIIERLRQKAPVAVASSPEAKAEPLSQAPIIAPAEAASVGVSGPTFMVREKEKLAGHAEKAAEVAVNEPLLSRLDPIAKWIFYIGLSTGILVQHRWFGVLAAAAVCALIAAIAGGSSRVLGGKSVRFFLFFIVLSSLLSGLSVQFAPLQIGFQAGPALVTAMLLLRFLLIMALGLLLIATTGERRMQVALEQAMQPLARFGFPVRLITFTTALMFRFLTMLKLEIERLSLIVTARGKAYVKPGTIRLRDVRLFFVPLLLSMMKHAEDLAFALEARGYRTRAGAAPSVKPISLALRDKLTMMAGLVLLAAFWLLRQTWPGV